MRDEEIRTPLERDADINRLRRLVLALSSWREFHEDDAVAMHGHALVTLARRLAGHGRRWRFDDLRDIREAGNAGPGLRAVGRTPEPVVARAEIQNLAIAGIDGEPFAVAASVLVAAEFERHIGALKVARLVVGTQDRAIGRIRVGICAERQVHAFGSVRIERDRLNAHQVQILVRREIENRRPAVRCGIAFVRSAHVGPGVTQVGRRGMEDDSIHKASADDLHVLPGVMGLFRTGSHGRGCSKGKKEQRSALSHGGGSLCNSF